MPSSSYMEVPSEGCGKDIKMKTNVKATGFLGRQEEIVRVSYMEKLANDTVTVENMEAMEFISMKNVVDVNTLLAKASYKAVTSKVGSTTVCMQVAGTDPVIYFNNGSFNKDLFAKVFNKNKEDVVANSKYESVFFEGINMFSKIDFAMGVRYTIYLVNAATIEEYRKRVSQLDLNTVKAVEDIAQIIKDLDPIARALQESSIDVTKDSSKDFGIYASDIVGAEIKALNNEIKKYGTTNNVKDCLADAKNVKYVARIGLDKEYIEENCIETDSAKAQLAILEGTNEFMDRLVQAYSTTTNDEYKKYLADARPHKDFVKFIREVMFLCFRRFEGDGTLTKEKISMVRDAIYTEAEARGIDKDLVIKCGIVASYTSFFTNIKTGEESASSNLNKIQFGMLTRLFDDVFVREYSDMDALEIEVDVDEVYVDIANGTEVILRDGVGYIADENNNIIDALTTMDMDLNGHAVVKDGKLMFKYVPENEISCEYKLVLLKDFLTYSEGEWKTMVVESSEDVAAHVSRLLNRSCGVINGVVFAKNPETGKGMRIATVDARHKDLSGAIDIVDVLIAKDGAALLIKA